jgi:starch phosphorylase
MLDEYVRKFYLPAAQQGRRYAEEGFAPARAVADWKARVRASWPKVAIRRLDAPPRRIEFGTSLHIEVAVELDGLAPSDVVVELLLEREGPGSREGRVRLELAHDGTRTERGEHRFVLELEPELCGRLDYRIRAYPCHELLTHPFELGLMVWV